VSVINAAAIRSWKRATRWIGSISPPAVVAYRERDSMGVFDAGNAASTTAILQGAVFDPSGAVVPAASVRVQYRANGTERAGHPRRG